MIDEKKLIEDISMLSKNINTYVKNIVHYVPTKCDNVEEIITQCKNIRKITTSFGVIIDNQPKVGEWVPVSESLPPMPEPNPLMENKPLELYLACEKDGDYPFRAIWNGKFFTNGFCKCEVSAWMPLPKQYERNAENGI